MISDQNTRRFKKKIFKKDRLPAPSVYYIERNFILKGRGAWCTTICPFHDDSKPSLSIHIESGAFNCFSCGTKGGDVLAFHRLYKGMTFAEAVEDLDAWEEI